MKVELQLPGFSGYIQVEDKQYVLTQVTINDWVNPKTNEKGPNWGREEREEKGYCKTIVGAIDKAIQISFSTRDEKLTLSEFLKEYKETRDSILNLI